MQRRSPLPSLVAVLALALAGCSGSEDAPSASNSSGPADGAFAGIPAPVHTVGDAWEWSSEQLGTYTYAIVGEDGEDFLVGTDSADVAFFDARSDISTLGPMRKSDLAGSQRIDGTMQRVEFFRFPLLANATWTATWDGQPVAVRVLEADAETASLRATRSDGSTYATYTFEVRHGYFGHLTFHDGDGKPAFSSTVAKALKGYTGPVRSWVLDQVVDFGGAMTGSASTTFEVPANITDVYIEARIECTTGSFVAMVGPPTGHAEGRGFSETDPCPQSISENRVLATAPAQAENWGALFTAVPGAQGEYGIRVFLRTLVEA